MLSFEQNNNQIALIDGNDFKKGSGLYLYSQYEKGKHIDEAEEITEALHDVYDGDIMMNDIESGKKIVIGNQDQHFDNQLNLYGLNKYQLSPFQHTDEMKAIAIYGKSGAGKSYFVAEYIQNYLKLHNNYARILFWSQKELADDKNFNHLQMFMKQIDMNDQLENPFTIEDIKSAESKLKEKNEPSKPTLCIFDDCLSMHPYALKTILYSIQSFLKLGRQYRITVLITNQQSNEFTKTKLINDNTSHIVYFLHNNKNNLNQLLVKKHGFSQKEADFIVDIPTRWILLNDAFVLTQVSCFTIDRFKDYIRESTAKRR